MISATLKLLRERTKKSQKEVAADLALDYKRYNHYETGRSEPDISTITLLADYFDVTVDYLIGHEKKSPGAAEAAPEETRLIELYRELNAEGQEKLLDLADDMVRSGKYIKISPLELGKKAR